MKYVLDASVGIEWVMNEVDYVAARRVRDDVRNQIHELIAPDSFPCIQAMIRRWLPL